MGCAIRNSIVLYLSCIGLWYAALDVNLEDVEDADLPQPSCPNSLYKFRYVDKKGCLSYIASDLLAQTPSHFAAQQVDGGGSLRALTIQQYTAWRL